MRVNWIRIGVLAGVLAACGAASVRADVKSQERTQVTFEGMLGRMVGLFGGKAAREGIVSTAAVKGERKLTTTGETGEIIDLAEEKIYRLDLKKKTYTVLTFDELRRQLQEAQARAREQAQAAQPEPDREAAEEPQVEVDFDLKETGQTRSLLGHQCREVLMTVTVREKGKTLEEAGGMVLTSHSWLAPEIPALKEEAAFDLRYAQKLYGDMVSVEAMQQMAAAMAMYPGMKAAMDRMSKENVNLSGTPLLTTMTFQMVKSPQQVEQDGRESGGGSPASMGGLMGGLARKMMKKKEEETAPDGAANRATIMTSTSEVLSVSTEVSAADVDLPPGLKPAK